MVVGVGWFCRRFGSTELRKPSLVRRFDRIGKTSGLGNALVYKVYVNYEGFGAGRRSRKH